MSNIQTILGLRHVATVASDLPRVICTNPDLIAGLELEIENIGRLERAMDMVRPVWQVVEDGSLRPRNLSWEFVSRPMRMEELQAELQEFFRVNRHLNDTNYSDRTSVHVHTNVQDFTPQELSSLALVYSTVEDILFEWINNYNKGDRESFYRDTNLYCVPWTHSRVTHEIVRRFFNEPALAAKTWEKYTALNIQPLRDKGTVEWRHMHGTNDMDKLQKWLNIIGSIMKFSRTQKFDELVNTIQSLNDTSAYRQYFDSIFGGTIPYSDEYARRMSEGVINAKFALMNKDKKPEKKKSVWDMTFEEIRQHDIEARDDLRAARELANLQANRLAGRDFVPRARGNVAVQVQAPIDFRIPDEVINDGEDE